MEINVLFVHPDESRKSPDAFHACFGKLEKIPGVYVSLSVFDEELESLCVILECSKAKKVLASAVGEIEQSRFRGLLCNANQTVDY